MGVLTVYMNQSYPTINSNLPRKCFQTHYWKIITKYLPPITKQKQLQTNTRNSPDLHHRLFHQPSRTGGAWLQPWATALSARRSSHSMGIPATLEIVCSDKAVLCTDFTLHLQLYLGDSTSENQEWLAGRLCCLVYHNKRLRVKPSWCQCLY